MKYMIVLDEETTGLLAPDPADIFHQPHVTEIYCAKVNYKTLEVVDEFHSLLKPPVPIPDEIVKHTGITNEMVAGEPQFIEIYEDLCGFFLGVEVALGHNVNFDMDVLRHELRRIGREFYFPWPMLREDTIEIGYSIENRRLSLQKMHNYLFGKDFEGWHRAKSDVLATLKCYKELRERGYTD